MSEKSLYTDTKIATQFGDFNFRVYSADIHGKETVVLSTDNLNRREPVLVRVHSECLTGDLFKSLKCDCGPQLNKSLKIIKDQGGVLIYLRQEGRGIGLFEKIKTYQLQAKGIDTFDANVMLGHKPDARSYEMVKTVLNDLNINEIKILTNNPSKISEIAKFGINVVERKPVLIKANAHNEKYFATKSKKFHHIFEPQNNVYFYQFHIDKKENVKEIIDFVKQNIKDPLLEILVGISANHTSLQSKSEIKHIKELFTEVSKTKVLKPVLHFTFRDVQNISAQILNIKKILPFVKRIQLNDLPEIKLTQLRSASKHFQLDIPFCDKTFESLKDPKIVEFIKKTNSYVLLDNSKGRGIQESKEVLMKKIEILLNLDIKRIALFGGFGPDHLDTYFELRRYYKINFSIDAETKLKTNNEFSMEKTKKYLGALLLHK